MATATTPTTLDRIAQIQALGAPQSEGAAGQNASLSDDQLHELRLKSAREVAEKRKEWLTDLATEAALTAITVPILAASGGVAAPAVAGLRAGVLALRAGRGAKRAIDAARAVKALSSTTPALSRAAGAAREAMKLRSLATLAPSVIGSSAAGTATRQAGVGEWGQFGASVAGGLGGDLVARGISRFTPEPIKAIGRSALNKLGAIDTTSAKQIEAILKSPSSAPAKELPLREIERQLDYINKNIGSSALTEPEVEDKIMRQALASMKSADARAFAEATSGMALPEIASLSERVKDFAKKNPKATLAESIFAATDGRNTTPFARMNNTANYSARLTNDMNSSVRQLREMFTQIQGQESIDLGRQIKQTLRNEHASKRAQLLEQFEPMYTKAAKDGSAPALDEIKSFSFGEYPGNIAWLNNFRNEALDEIAKSSDPIAALKRAQYTIRNHAHDLRQSADVDNRARGSALSKLSEKMQELLYRAAPGLKEADEQFAKASEEWGMNNFGPLFEKITRRRAGYSGDLLADERVLAEIESPSTSADQVMKISALLPSETKERVAQYLAQKATSSNKNVRARLIPKIEALSPEMAQKTSTNGERLARLEEMQTKALGGVGSTTRQIPGLERGIEKITELIAREAVGPVPGAGLVAKAGVKGAMGAIERGRPENMHNIQSWLHRNPEAFLQLIERAGERPRLTRELVRETADEAVGTSLPQPQRPEKFFVEPTNNSNIHIPEGSEHLLDTSPDALKQAKAAQRERLKLERQSAENRAIDAWNNGANSTGTMNEMITARVASLLGVNPNSVDFSKLGTRSAYMKMKGDKIVRIGSHESRTQQGMLVDETRGHKPEDLSIVVEGPGQLRVDGEYIADTPNDWDDMAKKIKKIIKDKGLEPDTIGRESDWKDRFVSDQTLTLPSKSWILNRGMIQLPDGRFELGVDDEVWPLLKFEERQNFGPEKETVSGFDAGNGKFFDYVGPETHHSGREQKIFKLRNEADEIEAAQEQARAAAEKAADFDEGDALDVADIIARGNSKKLKEALQKLKEELKIKDDDPRLSELEKRATIWPQGTPRSNIIKQAKHLLDGGTIDAKWLQKNKMNEALFK